MGFLSPWFLAGLAAIGLPFWLHLLRRFRRTPHPFSSLMFFERRIQSSTKHRRLRYLALMAMRMAVLALIALAFADPFVLERSTGARRRAVTVIAVDRSFSMRAANRMAEAKAEANRIVDSLPQRTQAQVLAFDSQIQMLTEAQASALVLHSAINSLEPVDDVSSYGELSRALRAMQQTTGLRLAANVITDVQKTSMPAAFSDLELGPNISLELHPVGRTTPNWAVESVSVPSRVFESTTVKLSATIAGWQSNAVNRTAVLDLDGRKVASQHIDVPGCGHTRVEFDGLDVRQGWHGGHVSRG